ncbi:Hypothetical predicted protein, partial [Paramuricea clavata]
MDDSSDDESFYTTQSSTGRRSATTDIDDHLFDTTTLFDDGQLQNAVTGKNTEKTVGVTSFDLFEDGEIDGELFEAASLFDSEKARHTETNKEIQNAGAAKRFESLQGKRFRKPITSSKCERFGQSWTSEASRKKWRWVLRTFEKWRAARNHAVSSNNESYDDEPLVNTSLEEMSDEQLDFFLARFVAEVRKTDGAEYPGRTIYEMISSIQAYLHVECKRNVNLIDKTAHVFRNLNSALNFVMKERAGQGIGVETSQAKFITEEQENYLWEHGFLGCTNAALLRDTLAFVFGLQFALRAGQEHRNLRRENSQLSLQVDEFGDEFLAFIQVVPALR